MSWGAAKSNKFCHCGSTGLITIVVFKDGVRAPKLAQAESRSQSGRTLFVCVALLQFFQKVVTQKTHEKGITK